ncbi:ferric reduction oxidase 2-like [Prunus yedoensis var. nudiflora]|uniref:ferric-chelate reductase (NADH) n=1 Tax=Prunus yedoensis var. nudiflora TaxID=2094558 RepID=A0A314ZKY1_PRUYE|nr:ferric reduction oxidase 2-like [Prunus yedoensis var. nudiflora]
MWATSFPRIRRQMFELFFYTHHLYIVFVVFYVFHVKFSYACTMLPGFYLFIIDRTQLFSNKHGVCKCTYLSKLQWHPFSVTSSSKLDADKLSVVIKSEGNWSQNLYQKLSSTQPIDRLQVSVEGPYGPVSNDMLRHDTIVMVSGGSGITPLISIIRELLFRANNSGTKTPQILLICAFGKSLDLTMLNLILPVSGTDLDISCLQLQIEAYVTREREPTSNSHKPFQTICFKPDPLDVPPQLQQQGFYGTRNRVSRRLGQIQAIDASTPITTSPSACYRGGDQELESLPHRSFVKSTKVYYDRRPDLKGILSDCEGSSIGVLVSGPRRMRQEVAAICSSGLVNNNLHCHSMSFSW